MVSHALLPMIKSCWIVLLSGLLLIHCETRSDKDVPTATPDEEMTTSHEILPPKHIDIIESIDPDQMDTSMDTGRPVPEPQKANLPSEYKENSMMDDEGMNDHDEPNQEHNSPENNQPSPEDMSVQDNQEQPSISIPFNMEIYLDILSGVTQLAKSNTNNHEKASFYINEFIKGNRELMLKLHKQVGDLTIQQRQPIIDALKRTKEFQDFLEISKEFGDDPHISWIITYWVRYQ